MTIALLSKNQDEFWWEEVPSEEAGHVLASEGLRTTLQGFVESYKEADAWVSACEKESQ